MQKINYENIKVIKQQLYSQLDEKSPDYYHIASLAMEFKKYINYWNNSNREKSWEEFQDAQKNDETLIGQEEKIDCSVLVGLSVACYYKKEITNQEAYLFLKSVYAFEKDIIILESSERKEIQIWKKTV